jgi:hypothetical protein
MLKAMPATQIKRIEIITSPGSSKSASSTGGIINLIIDDPSQGYIGSLSVNVLYYKERVSPYISIWNGYAYKNFSLSLSVGYSGDSTHDITTNAYNYRNAGFSIVNDTESTGWNNMIFGSLNAQYKFTSKSVLGIALRINEDESTTTSNIHSKYENESSESVDYTVIKAITPWKRPNYGIQGYYTLITDRKGSNIDISVDYTNKLLKKEMYYYFESNNKQERTDVSSVGTHFNPKYRFILNDKHNLSVGYDMLNSKIDNSYLAEVDNNRFVYKETINSGYAEWAATWSNALSMIAGVRVENSLISGKQSATGESFKQNYTDFFPSLSLSINLPWRGNQNISLDVSRTIFRPFYSSLNPFVYWSSETTCSKGNIDLKPEYNWNYSLYYSFLTDFIFGASFRTMTNSQLDYKYNDGGITVSSTSNFGKSKSLYSFLSYNRTFGGFWRLKSNICLMYSDYNASLEDIDLNTTSLSYSFSIQNSVSLFKDKLTRIFVDYSFYSPVKSITGTWKYKNLLSVYISKKFKNGVTIKLSASNLLGYKNNQHYCSPLYSYREHSGMYPSQFSVTFNYVFGKRMVSGAEDRYNSALDNRFRQ